MNKFEKLKFLNNKEPLIDDNKLRSLIYGQNQFFVKKTIIKGAIMITTLGAIIISSLMLLPDSSEKTISNEFAEKQTNQKQQTLINSKENNSVKLPEETLSINTEISSEDEKELNDNWLSLQSEEENTQQEEQKPGNENSDKKIVKPSKYYKLDKSEMQELGIILSDDSPNILFVPVEIVDEKYFSKSSESIQNDNLETEIYHIKKNHIGLYFDYQTLYITDLMQFSNLPGYELSELCDCLKEPLITFGYQGGFEYKHFTNKTFSLGFRLGYALNEFEANHDDSFMSEKIERDPDTGQIINRYLVETITTKRVYLNTKFFTFEPYAEFTLFNHLNIIAGPSIYYLIQDKTIADISLYSEEEDIEFESGNLEPGAVLSDDGKTITYYDGKIPNKNTFLPGILFGISLDLNINNLIISPEAQLRYSLNHLSQENYWLIHRLNLGLSMSYRF